jgi:hypothetical protein
MWFWQIITSNTFRFSCVLSLNACVLDEVSKLTFMGLITSWAQRHIGLVTCQTLTLLNLAICWVQVHMSLARRQTQFSWIYLYVEPKYKSVELKCIWVWQDVRPITLGFGIFPNPIHRVDNLLSSLLGHMDFFCLFSCLLI